MPTRRSLRTWAVARRPTTRLTESTTTGTMSRRIADGPHDPSSSATSAFTLNIPLASGSCCALGRFKACHPPLNVVVDAPSFCDAADGRMIHAPEENPASIVPLIHRFPCGAAVVAGQPRLPGRGGVDAPLAAPIPVLGPRGRGGPLPAQSARDAVLRSHYVDARKGGRRARGIRAAPGCITAAGAAPAGGRTPTQA